MSRARPPGSRISQITRGTWPTSRIKRKFIVANENQDVERRLCDDLMQRFRAGEWDNPPLVDTYFRVLERFDPRIYAEFYDLREVLEDRRAGRLRSGSKSK